MKHGHSTIFFLFGLAACATGGPESTQEPEIPIAAEAMVVKHHVPDAAKKSGLVDEDTLICRKEKVVGSHIPQTVCLSARERENIQRTARSHMESGKRSPQPTLPEG